MKSRPGGLLLAIVLLVGGCGLEEPTRLGVAVREGRSLNGRSLNGRSLNGRSLNGTSLSGATLGSVSMDKVSLVGSQLVGSKGSKSYSGKSVVGMKLGATLANGSSASLRIDAVRSQGDIYFYDVSFAADGDPLCGTDDAGAPVEAIALAGVWNQGEGVTGGGSWTQSATSFTFACRSAALGKCVELGYRPWATSGGVSLRNHHQACTRLLRADYCGNGKSWTIDGRAINLYDDVSVQSDTESLYLFEAEWSASGAKCLSTQRQKLLLSEFQIVPLCILNLVSLTCGAKSHFNTGTVLMSEYRDLL